MTAMVIKAKNRGIGSEAEEILPVPESSFSWVVFLARVRQNPKRVDRDIVV